MDCAGDIVRAGKAAGFLDVRPATAHPFDRWRARLDALPFSRTFTLEHRPEKLCGWPVTETTVWSAAFPVPAFSRWPEGYCEVSNSFFRYFEMLPAIARWHAALRELGLEIYAEKPLPDRAAAIRAGWGTYGLFGPLITPGWGSRVCLVTTLVRMPPPPGTPGPERDDSPGCARCGRCIRACPAGAISEDGVNPLLCLRNDMYFPDDMPVSHYGLMGRRAIGCETCQRACPHNREIAEIAPTDAQRAPFRLESLLRAPDTQAMLQMLEPGYVNEKSLRMQAILAAANRKRYDLMPVLREICEEEDATLARAAAWALSLLENPEKADEEK